MSRLTPLLGALAALSLLACPASGAQEKDYGKRPDWSMTGPDGKKVSAADYDNKVLIVDFWATWCPPCVKEVPGFIALQKKYKEQGLVIVGFSFDRDKDVHDKWTKEQGMNYLSLFAQNEEGQKVVAQFQEKIGAIEGIPTTIIINKKGQIVYKHVGYGTPESFEKVFKPML
jgi:thiol-disulfide isomerase/thioredoxin